jgi:hypothetical protein
MLPAIILAGAAQAGASAQSAADRQQQVQMALDQYAAAKTPDQRATILDFLDHLDRKIVAESVVDHILAAHTGMEATVYNSLIESLSPESCAAVLARIAKTDRPTAKGKLLVALRHCSGEEVLKTLEGCLADKRPVLFEAHGPHPRRVCDMAYNELFLKLRSDPFYSLDPSSHMRGIITERTPEKVRDAEIAKLKEKLARKPIPAIPPPSPSPSATPAPSPAKPVAVAIAL